MGISRVLVHDLYFYNESQIFNIKNLGSYTMFEITFFINELHNKTYVIFITYHQLNSSNPTLKVNQRATGKKPKPEQSKTDQHKFFITLNFDLSRVKLMGKNKTD